MHFLYRLLETVLMEDAVLTKGSQRVMNDKKLVAGLADAVRDDAASHPQNFPPNSKRTFQKAPDEELAKWFLENIDKIEKEGYEGTVYSRDGVYSDWIVRRYIAGSHNWEDITGVMNMNMRDWTLLKNRNMLDPNHRDIPKFNSVRDLGKYMSTHYAQKLEKIRDAARNAARNKLAKSVKLVDNDDYRIYTTLNRAAGCALGLGTQWCTANSTFSGHFHSYTSKAMLFQLFPYTKQEENGNIVNVTDEDGDKVLNDKEKFQFDAGGPSFMDITDRGVPTAIVAQKFPYLFTDLSKGLKQNKEKMEKAFEELSADPVLQGEDFKIKTYEIDKEIEKLHKFVDRGYFTDKVRPTKRSVSSNDGNTEQPQVIEPEVAPEQNNQQMESFEELVKALIEKSVNDEELIVSKKEVVEDDEEMEPENLGISPPSQAGGLSGAGAGPTGGGKYPSGTAPTMPESINKGKDIMENIDKDVAAMLSNLKKYDKLVESVSPVLGMVTLGEKKGDLPPWLKDKDSKKTDPEAKDEDKDADDKEQVDEGADQEVIAWMGRFSKLGNMKGYGR